MNNYVLFHGGCWDGLTAAWIIRSVLNKESTTYIPVQYNAPPPTIEGPCNLYILDFCFPLDQMLKWWRGAIKSDPYVQDLVVCDHHKSHEEVLRQLRDMDSLGRRTILFDANKSGARLTWQHIYGNSNIPPPGLVDYTEDRDLWTWKLPGSREVNACLRSFPLEFATLDRYARHTYQMLYSEMFGPGQAILRREKQIIDQHVQFAILTKMFGYNDIPVVNSTVLTSEIVGELAKGKPFAASYFDTKDGNRVWSLRSDDNGVDVSELAKKMAGGGHKHAAGFTTLSYFAPIMEDAAITESLTSSVV